jgi:hypothetical protein
MSGARTKIPDPGLRRKGQLRKNLRWIQDHSSIICESAGSRAPLCGLRILRTP